MTITTIDKARKKELSNLLFVLGWSIYLVSYVLLTQTEIMYLYDVSPLYDIAKLIVIFIFIIKAVFASNFSKNKLLVYLATSSIAFINSILISNNTLFFLVLIALSANDVDFKNLIKTDMKIRIVLLLSIVGFSLLGYLPNYARLINGSMKQAFGFTHPNVLCFFAITILLELMYLTKRISLKYILINCIAIYILTTVCFSKTSVYTFVIIFLANIAIRNKDKLFNNRIIKQFLILLPVILLAISVVVVIGYGNGSEISQKIDAATTERVKSGYRFYKEYGIKLFGNNIKTIGTRAALYNNQKTNIFDMGFLRLLINYGISITFIIITLLCALQKRTIDKKEYRLLLISSFFIITGFAENNVYNIIMNFSLLYIPFIFEKPNNKIA